MNIPESWLERVGGHDASGWLGAFCRDRKAAVSELLWNRFYLGPLNVLERGHVLAGWLEAVGDDHGFAGMLDEACSEWVRLNWGRFDEDGVRQGSAWMCAASLVEFSARLGPASRLGRTAGELRARFAGRETFLGSFSTSPTADPLGFYLAAVAEFQGADRSMAAMWHRMCDLPDGVPPYHARYAMLGLRRLPAADPVEAGTLRAEVVRGLVRLAMGFDRLVRERGMPEALAQATFGPVISQVVAAYPGSGRWVEHGLELVRNLPDRPRRWVLSRVPQLAEGSMRLGMGRGGDGQSGGDNGGGAGARLGPWQP